MMKAGKSYRIVVVFTYDVYEAKVICIKKLPKSYRVKMHETGEIKTIRMEHLTEAEEIAMI